MVTELVPLYPLGRSKLTSFLMILRSYLNQDSSVNVMLGYGLADQELKFQQGKRIFGASKTSRLSLGSSRPPIQWVPKFLLQVKAAWA
jgi:hypothetical protein